MNKKLILLVLVGIVGSIFFFRFLRRTKTSAFLEARNKSCRELEKNTNQVYSQNKSFGYNSSIEIKKCDCYYARDKPNKEIERKSTNYCICNCTTNKGNVVVNVRKSP